MTKKVKNIYIDKDSHIEVSIYGMDDSVKGIALISKEFEDIVKGYSWCIYRNKKRLYAHTHIGNGKYLKMHRLIARVLYGDSSESVDHKNRNGLDNRVENISYASDSEQNHNKDLQKNNTSGVKGVTYNKKYGKWRAEMNYQKQKFCKHFDSFEDAVNQRKIWEENKGV